MEIFSINKEIVNVNRIEELEEKIDRLIDNLSSHEGRK